jgi:hypothetical protein
MGNGGRDGQGAAAWAGSGVLGQVPQVKTAQSIHAENGRKHVECYSG